MSPSLWVVIAAAVLSGFFSTAAYSLRAFRRVQLEEALGASGAARLAALDRHLPELTMTAALCRALANLALAVAMVYLFGGHERGLGVSLGFGDMAWAVAASAVVLAIFGVAIPHAWASSAGERFLAATLPILLALRYALYPAVVLMQAVDVPIRRLVGAEARAAGPDGAAKQEILQMASEAQAAGSVEPEEARMIASVMEFGQTQVDKIMTPRTAVFALPVETTVGQARPLVVQAGHSRVPVYDGDLDNVVGILYAKDLLKPMDENAPVRATTRKPFFVPETKRLDDLLREFKGRKVHLAVVLDEYGGTAGLVTFEDVLEEIVGDIADEYDRTEPALMHRIGPGEAEVDGRMYIDDLNEALGLSIPEDQDYDTVAGFVFSALGYIPAAGEVLQADGAKFTVLAADARKITRLRVESVGPQEGR